MPFFNIIHPIVHSLISVSKTDGKKNSITFLTGTLLWCMLWVFLVNFKNSPFYQALQSMFMVCVIADITAISYTYKSYYNRSIICEAGQSQSWKFDPDNKKYSRKDECDIFQENISKIKRFDEIQKTIDTEQEKELTKQRTDNIIETKNKQRAAIYIQTWWREKLYAPGKGIFYKQSESNFEQNNYD